MIQTKGHYPYKQALYLNVNKKIVGKADDEELNILIDVLSKDIENLSPALISSEIKHILSKSIIYFTSQARASLRGIEACAIGKRIFIDQSILKFIVENNIDELKKSNIYYDLLHESIHVIQNYYSPKRRHYKGNDLVGLIEGATENAVVKKRNIPRSIRYKNSIYNFQTHAVQYAPSIAIIKQLEIIFGNELVDRFTYKKDLLLIDELINNFGKDFTYSLLKETSKYAISKKFDYNIEFFQNYMMKKYFTNELENVNTQNEAELLLKKLRSFGDVLVRDNSNDEYELFYNYVLRCIKSKLPDFKSILYDSYQSPNYFPIETKKDIYNKLHNQIIDKIIVEIYNENKDVNKMLSDLNRLSLDDIKLHLYENDGCIIAIFNIKDSYYCFKAKLNNNDYSNCSININTNTNGNEIVFGNNSEQIIYNKSKNNIVITDDLKNRFEIEESLLQLKEIPLNLSLKEVYNALKSQIEVELLFSNRREKRKYKLQGYEDFPEYEEIKNKVV